MTYLGAETSATLQAPSFGAAETGFHLSPDAGMPDPEAPSTGGSNWTPRTGGTLNANEIYWYARKAGFGQNDAITMTAIALAESSGNTQAHNGKAPDNSYGLWQINMLGAMGPERQRQFGITNNVQLFNPSQNAAAALKIYRQQGLKAWSTYTNGSYQRYMAQARAASTYNPAPGAAGTGVSSKRQAVIDLAKKYIGVNYVWGGSSPTGFDCSGLVQYAFSKNGINMPRVAFQQAGKGKHVAISQLQPGDLVGWDEGGNIGIGHIAIYLGNGQILEAPHTGAKVRIRKLGNGSFDRHAFGVKLNY